MKSKKSVPSISQSNGPLRQVWRALWMSGFLVLGVVRCPGLMDVHSPIVCKTIPPIVGTVSWVFLAMGISWLIRIL